MHTWTLGVLSYGKGSFIKFIMERLSECCIFKHQQPSRTKEGDVVMYNIFHGLLPKTLPVSMGTIYDNMNLA